MTRCSSHPSSTRLWLAFGFGLSLSACATAVYEEPSGKKGPGSVDLAGFITSADDLANSSSSDLAGSSASDLANSSSTDLAGSSVNDLATAAGDMATAPASCDESTPGKWCPGHCFDFNNASDASLMCASSSASNLGCTTTGCMSGSPGGTGCGTYYGIYKCN